MSNLRILLVQCEMNSWRGARSWSYNLHVGWEEGFKKNNISFFTLTTTWINQLKRLLAGKKFDQIWINDLVLSNRGPEDINKEQLAFLATLAPVRVGLLTESVYDYSTQERTQFPHLKQRAAEVEKSLPYLTHVLTYDETDVAVISEHWGIPVMWYPSCVVSSLIYKSPPSPHFQQAFFSGSVYGKRQSWLSHPSLKKSLASMPSPDQGALSPIFFDLLHHRHISRLMQLSITSPFYRPYIKIIRAIRRQSYERWLVGLQSGVGVVNLPHLVKSYTPRVIEGMAAGRPVLSWKIPNRPKNEALFEHNKEILLFENPDELAEHIQRLQIDTIFAKKIAGNAQKKIEQFHTTKQRVQQIQYWIATGNVPNFN